MGENTLTVSSAPAPRILRHGGPDELVADAAQTLLDQLVARQGEQDAVHLCLSGGSAANQVYAAFAELASDSDLDVGKLHIWWSDEMFVPTIDPERNATQSLALLARRLQLNTAQIHSMPASDGNADPGESAFAYAQELGDTDFDVLVLGMGVDGHVASIFPRHSSSEPTSKAAIGVQDAPKPPSERISLTVPTLNRAGSTLLLVSGPEKAQAVAEALAPGSVVPAAQVRGRRETLWFVDEDAAALLPRHDCEL